MLSAPVLTAHPVSWSAVWLCVSGTCFFTQGLTLSKLVDFLIGKGGGGNNFYICMPVLR